MKSIKCKALEVFDCLVSQAHTSNGQIVFLPCVKPPGDLFTYDDSSILYYDGRYLACFANLDKYSQWEDIKNTWIKSS